MKTIILSLLACAVTAAQQPLMHRVATTAERPSGTAEYADVCFRYMSVRTNVFPTVEDAKQAMRAFHATRVEWFYTGTADPGAQYVTPEAKKFIDWCRAQDMQVGGAMHTLTTEKAWKSGTRLNMGRYNGDPANPDYVKAAVAWGKAQIDAGVATMVCDDLFGYATEEKRRQFSDNVIAAIKAHKPGFTIGSNHGGTIDTRYVKPYAFDFHYSDNNFVPGPGQWWAASKAHRALKSAILVHPNRPRTTDTHRVMIALAYAAGAHVITPWDEYIHGGERLFADPADFADLYGFVRALGQAGYLNGHEDAAVGGYDLKETRYGSLQPITVSGGSGKLRVFARAVPADPKAPLVFHLVESDKPTAAKLKLHQAAASQLGAARLKCELLSPPPYEQAVHDKAASNKEYAALARSTELSAQLEGEHLVFDIPAIKHWAVLVITAQPSP